MRILVALAFLASTAWADEMDVRAPEKRARAEVTTLLEDKAAAWNRGDLERFAAAYADDAVLVSPAGLTRGRDEILARYRKRYPDEAARGTLSFEILDVRYATSPKDATRRKTATPPPVRGVTVLAKWKLARDEAPAEGHTLLVFLPKERGGWVIAQDASF